MKNLIKVFVKGCILKLNDLNKTREIWNDHYTKSKSKLKYPDENLVRILNSINKKGKALDFGAGSGRHCLLLKNFGFEVYAADYSQNAINQIQDLDPEIQTQYISSPPFDYQDSIFDLIVSWGVLHYNKPSEVKKIISEYHRILKKDGILAGTIRSNNDTHLKEKDKQIQMNDLLGGQIFLYGLEELKNLLKDFKHTDFGYSERTPIGKLDERICHWIFKAQK